MFRSLVIQAIVLTFASCGSNLKPMPKASGSLTFSDYQKLESLLHGSDSLPVSSDCDHACQERRQEFRFVTYVGQKIYCYWDQKLAETGTDFLALANSLETQITTGMTLSGYYRVLRQWAAAFHDGHVNVMAGADSSELETFTANVRFEVLKADTADETVIISETKDIVGLKTGDVVISINGKATKDYLDDMESIRSGSTKRMRRFFSSRLISDAVGADMAGDAIAITVKKTDGTEVPVKIPRKTDLTAKPTPNSQPTETSGTELIKVAILPGGIGYVRLDGFGGEQSSFLINQAMNRVAATKGLLIDLRANGGGDQSGNNIINRLTYKPVTRYKVSERMSDFLLHARPDIFNNPWTIGSPFADWRDLTIDPAPENLSYKGKPVIALTSNHCFSACDTFVSALKVNQLGKIVGESTAGGTGSPLVFDLEKSGLRFRYSVVRGHTAADTAIEGAGTDPDVYLPPTVAERIKGKDDQLEKAIEILLSDIQGTSTSTGQSATAQEGSSEVTRDFGLTSQQGFELSPTTRDAIEASRQNL